MVADLVERELDQPKIQAVSTGEDSLSVDLTDGRTIITPLLWYPRLSYASATERQNFQILRSVIYWPELDEEVSVRGMLLGRMSGESSHSIHDSVTLRYARC